MRSLRCVVLLELIATFAFGQVAHQGPSTKAAQRPETPVSGLYTLVVARHPLGIPAGEDIKVFAPYLSKAMLHKIDINVACQDDWDRQNPDRNSKPPFLEFGLFSGDDARAEPKSFSIERAQAENAGSIRVNVKLAHDEPGQSPWTWHVGVILTRENGHLVVDDVIFPRYTPLDADVRLSEYLSQGCDGPHWVGHAKKDVH